MKKTLFAVLVCTLMTLTLTGCGSKVETDNRVGNVSIEELNDINKKKCRIHKQSLINSTYGRRTPHRSRPH